MIGFGYWHGNCLGAGRGPGMRMVLGNPVSGRGEAIGGPGLPMHQPVPENRATARSNRFGLHSATPASRRFPPAAAPHPKPAWVSART